MKTNILQENLLKALHKTVRVVPVRPQLPILNNVRILAEKGNIRVTCSSLDITESVSVPAKTEKEGGICVPARVFADFVSSLSQDTVSIEVVEGSLKARCAGATASIPGVLPEEFPAVDSTKKGKQMIFEKTKFSEALSLVLFSASSDDSRPMFTGVNIEKDENGLVMVATDGYRLSLKKISTKSKDVFDCVVPARALAEVLKILNEEKNDDPLEISEGTERQLVITASDTEIVARLLDGEYPPYKKIIPSGYITRIRFDKAALLHAVKSAAVFARDNANIVRFNIDGQKVTVSANTPQVGENTVEVDATVEGEEGTIAFNSRFLLEFLNSFSEQEMFFEMSGSLNPGVFRPVNDETYLHIIMPVRVQQ